MQKRKLIFAILTAILALVFLMEPMSQVEVVRANFVPAPTFTISVFSPKETVYDSNTLTLNFSVVGSDWHNTVRYKLDEGNFQAVTNFKEVSRERMPPMNWFGKQYNWTQYTFLGTEVISGLSDGNHSLSVYNGYIDPNGQFLKHDNPVTVYFDVETSSPTPSVPEFSLLMILLLFLSTFFVVVLFRKRKLSSSHD
jgi:hypothetical protein